MDRKFLWEPNPCDETAPGVRFVTSSFFGTYSAGVVLWYFVDGKADIEPAWKAVSFYRVHGWKDDRIEDGIRYRKKEIR